MNDLAPVGVSTYSRINHLRKTIEALQKNTLAKDTELYVFSDAPQPGDEKKVKEVREYLRTIKGFKTVNIIARKYNSRVDNNRGGMRSLLNQFGRIIFIEEDVVTAPEFLSFMNEALELYKEEKKVFSISGWCPKFKESPPLAKGSTFFVPRFCGWGFGIWKDRFNKLPKIGVDDIAALHKNPIALDRIHMQMGRDLILMIQAEALGKIDALDVRFCYYQAITGDVTLYPYPSLTKNIGLDGTGEHCGKQLFEINGEFAKECIKEYLFLEDVLVNEKVAKIYAQAFQRRKSLISRIKNCFR